MTYTRCCQLTEQQITFLLNGIAKSRIGKDGKGYAHVEAWDIRRHLIRVFGFGGFDTDQQDMTLVAQLEHKPSQPNAKSRWTVIYRATVRLVVKCIHGVELGHWHGTAAGDAANQPSLADAHDLAMKTADSQAFKRAAVNLGDAFGLSLYNNGSIEPVVLRSLAYMEPSGPVQQEREDPPVQPEPQAQPAETPPEAPEPAPAAPAEPADNEEPATAGPDDAPAQRIANLAAQQPAEWRRYWKAGAHARVMEHEITAPDTGKREQLGIYLTRLGKSATDGASKERAAVIEAGRRHGLNEAALAEEFARSYRHPMDEATPDELRKFAGLMNGAAA